MTPLMPPQAAPAAQAQPAAPTPAQLPPPISQVADGTLPAIRFPPEKRNESASPLSAFVATNLDGIARAGVAFTELPDKQSVLFNPVKTSKAAIHKAYAEGKLDTIPEIKAVPKPKTSLAPKTRTIHAAPVDLSPTAATTPDTSGGPPAASAAAPTNSANAPAGAGAAPADPDVGHVRVDKKLMASRVQALQKSGEREGGLPATVLSKLSKRAL